MIKGGVKRMDKDNPKRFCYLIRNGKQCVKNSVDKKHLAYYECEKCIWRVRSEDSKHLDSLKKIYEKYGTKRWN